MTRKLYLVIQIRFLNKNAGSYESGVYPISDTSCTLQTKKKKKKKIMIEGINSLVCILYLIGKLKLPVMPDVSDIA